MKLAYLGREKTKDRREIPKQPPRRGEIVRGEQPGRVAPDDEGRAKREELQVQMREQSSSRKPDMISGPIMY